MMDENLEGGSCRSDEVLGTKTSGQFYLTESGAWGIPGLDFERGMVEAFSRHPDRRLKCEFAKRNLS
jgi:hypothetical protein